MSAKDTSKHVTTSPAFTAPVSTDEVRRVIAERISKEELTLHYADLPLLEEEVDLMPLPQQQEIMRDLPFFQRFKLIELSDYPVQLIQSMPGHELLYTMKEVGESTGFELLSNAKPEQFQTILDVDTWIGGEIDADACMDYLFKLITLNPTSIEQINGIDDLNLLLAVISKIRVVRKEWFEEHAEVDPDNFVTLDDFYSFEWLDPDANNEHTWGVLTQLYKLDHKRYMWVMEAAIHEMPENLTEECLKDREGRMSDLGFPEHSFALEILQREKPSAIISRIRKGHFPKDASLTKNHATYSLPVLYKAVPKGELLFNAALGQLPAEWIAGIEQELMFLSNRIIIARRFESDFELAAEGVAYTRDCLNLGLDYLAEGALPQAEAILRSTALSGLFRLGNNLGYAVRDRARRLLRSFGNNTPVKDLPLITPEERDFLTGAVADFSQFTTVLATEGPADEKHRPFRYASDYHRAMEILDRMETMRTFLLDVLNAPKDFFNRTNMASYYPSEPGSVTPAHVFNTAMITRAVDGAFVLRGITPKDINTFIDAVAPDGNLDVSIRNDLDAWISSLTDAFNERQISMLKEDILSSFDVLATEIKAVHESKPRRHTLLEHAIISSALS